MENDAGFPGRGAAVYRGAHLDSCRCRIWPWIVSYKAQAQGYFPPGRLSNRTRLPALPAPLLVTYPRAPGDAPTLTASPDTGSSLSPELSCRI